ncbi:MAG: RNA polymerase sigma factor [Bacteroidales bacterium]|jgi:RNA polymerase sigma-70 factor (ECF subfamily)|nr:RNA polymerase sigma factor [Bacteroidales bacterium]
MSDYSDEQLLKMFRNESSRHKAFGCIVEQYGRRLYWHIRKIVIVHEDADDVLQNTFEKAWKGLSDFRQEAQLFTWLYRIATNEAVSFLQQKRNRSTIPLDDAEMLSASLQNDSYFSGDQIQMHLQKAILKLPEKQRIVFNMKYFEEMPYQKMSAILDTSVGALKASYHHAVMKIKAYFENASI